MSPNFGVLKRLMKGRMGSSINRFVYLPVSPHYSGATCFPQLYLLYQTPSVWKQEPVHKNWNICYFFSNPFPCGFSLVSHIWNYNLSFLSLGCIIYQYNRSDDTYLRQVRSVRTVDRIDVEVEVEKIEIYVEIDEKSTKFRRTCRFDVM